MTVAIMIITTKTIRNSYCADIHVNLTFSAAYYNILRNTTVHMHKHGAPVPQLTTLKV